MNLLYDNNIPYVVVGTKADKLTNNELEVKFAKYTFLT